MANVLIADDSAVMVNEVSSFLKQHSIDSVIACNGQEGFNILKENLDIPLAIVDINMPVLDGLSMIEKVRNELPDCQTKFIMLTTEFGRESKERGRSLGVKGWIIKPFQGDMVIEAIKKFL
ncbi:two-component system chemotaxis response regulator CheY [Alteromonadaceae bacterium 2753L.S.0a.02]|nr:two-component system chemotaxis response regulator CheY [Alteromonadaceae bacterium 2753L.S.0a.02]